MLHHKFERDDLSVDPIATCCKPSTLKGLEDLVVDEVNDRERIGYLRLIRVGRITRDVFLHRNNADVEIILSRLQIYPDP
mmetsp:Transcript_15262/g.21702  ORF Transcript_15262/g.21702 Transcript_15262/m.21702 type:complete len:80 (+) Transcript_15262:461-700(+)